MKVRLRVSLAIYSLVALFCLVMPVIHAAHHEKGTAADEVTVSAAHARAVSPVQKNSAVFMTLMNHSKSEHAVVRVGGDVAQAVELHAHINDGGIMRMRPVQKITLAAGAKTELKSGGAHVMLIGLNRTLEEGDMVHIELEFEDGSKKMLMVPVKKVMTMDHGSPQMKDHKHNM